MQAFLKRQCDSASPVTFRAASYRNRLSLQRFWGWEKEKIMRVIRVWWQGRGTGLAPTQSIFR
jgi:hypothetical protein